MITISGGIYNFYETGYIPTSWSGGIYNFGTIFPAIEPCIQWVESNYAQWVDDGNWYQWCGFPATGSGYVDISSYIKILYNQSGDLGISIYAVPLSAGLNQVYMDLNNAYSATTSGMSVYRLETENLIANLSYDSGFNSLCGNEDRIYFATPYDGIKYIYKSDISGNESNPVELSIFLNDYDYYSLTSSNVKYIHCNESVLACCTDSSVDVVASGSLGNYHTYLIDNIESKKCFITSSGTLYYTLVGTGFESVDVVVDTSTNWAVPDYSWCTGSGILPNDVIINDIFVTESTSVSGYNTLFVATTSGAYVIDEYDSNYNVYLNNNNITAVWADENSSLYDGSLYISTSVSFSVYNLNTGSLSDYYNTLSGVVDITTSLI